MLLRNILKPWNRSPFRPPSQTLSAGSKIIHSKIIHGSIRMSSSLKFSSFDVTNQVFFQTSHSFAIVNLKPIAPGHVLVIPKRTEAKRLADLSRDEVADLFTSVQRVGSVMESVHKASSLTVAIQANLRPNDFVPNDKIYDHLNRFDGSCEKESDKHQVGQLIIDNEERAARTLEDMQEEAKSLSQHFQD
ncbi:hypothetical protein PGTUg99_002353 [Puccinia graminis f. sp. tritici]|uniref:HIT domain-containing protein n=1 Tax=Puccinia graminis f. sp. tritici TaxID=56615 RepID=A0A5B0SGS6_PUCGR|nr:hypothetical protein PGTUg99_002353 [Puccinia graminis f. sp. tritici]